MKPRKITKSKVKEIYSFYSHKADRKYLVESGLEYDACFIFEYDPEIVHFAAQPQGFKYEEFGRVGRYTPDFLLCFTDTKKKYIEVKSKRHTENPVFQDLFQCKKEKALSLGFDLEYMTEDIIRKEPLISNLKFLDYYHKQEALDDIDYQILEYVECNDKVSIRNVIECMPHSHYGKIKEKIYNLLAKTKLFASFNDKLISVETILSKPADKLSQ